MSGGGRMSRLDELIAELCPDGVEYKTLGEVATISRGASPRPIKNFVTEDVDGVNWIKIGDTKPESKYISSCQERITKEGAKKSKYVHKGDFLLSNSMSFGRPYILQIDGCIHDGWLSLSGFTNYLIPDYLYYILSSSTIQKVMAKKASFGGAVQNLNSDIVKSILIPVPPLEVQREIVRILDAFTELTAELTAELDARKKQATYYKDRLLSVGSERTQYELQEICQIVDCPHTSPKWKDSGIPVIRNYNLVNGFIDTTTLSYVDEEEYAERTKRIVPQKDDILFSREAPIGNVGLVPEGFRCCQGQRVVLLRPNAEIVNPTYLLHTLQGTQVKRQIQRREMQGATVSNFNIADLKKLQIDLPTLEIQNEVVEKLNRFDKLCNDITAGLPAEIEARRKQYEYYRDRLLTFKEKTA